MGVLDELEGTPPAPSSGRLYISPETTTEKRPSVLDGLDTSPPPDAAYGHIDTAAMHGLHGITGGFSDELMGLTKAGGGDEKGVMGIQHLIAGLYGNMFGGEDGH